MYGGKAAFVVVLFSVFGPSINWRMVAAFVSRMASMTNLPVESNQS